MRKILFLITIMVGTVLSIQIVKADMGAPSISPYEVRVTKTEGTTLTNEEKNTKAPYDTILKVNYEYLENGIMFGEVEWNKEIYMVKLSDTEVIKQEERNPQNFDREEMKYVYKEGAYLYKGPSKIYGKVDGEIMIPVGAKIKVSIRNEDEIWAYVTYEGVSGWIYYYKYDDHSPYQEKTSLLSVIDEEKEIPFITSKEIKITKNFQTEEIITTIPNNLKTSAKFKYYYNPNPHTKYYYISWNGVEGWIQNENYQAIGYEIKNATLYSIKEIDIYQSDFQTKTNHTIPANTEVDILYMNNIWYYISYKGIEGYVKEYNEETESKNFLPSTNTDQFYLENINHNNNYTEAILKNDIQIYKEINGVKTDNILTSGEKIKIKYAYYHYQNGFNNVWEYIIADNLSGWIKNAEKEILEPETKKETEEKQENITPKKSLKEITIYCVISALILSLVSFVTIRLINKIKTK